MKSSLMALSAVVIFLLLNGCAPYRDSYGMVAPDDSAFNGGRVGAPLPTVPVLVAGTLVDAGCRDRSQENLISPPIPLNNEAPAEPPEEEAAENAQRAKTGFASQKEPQAAGITAFGITVDKQTLEQEQADVLPHQARDLYNRQPDASCAVTGDTDAFALLTDNGRLLDLDGGGNTWAWQAVQSTDAGRNLLSGMGSGIKPRVRIKGQIWADQLIVESLSL